MDRLEDLIALVVIVGSWIVQAIRAQQKKRRAEQQTQSPQPAPAPAPAPRRAPPPPRPPASSRPAPSSPGPRPARSAPASAPASGLTPALVAALADLDTRAHELSVELENDRATYRLAEPLRAWSKRHADSIRQAAESGASVERLRGGLAIFELVFAEARAMAEERRTGALGAALGDADALAVACYRPVITWARAENIPLAAAEPVTRWGAYPLSVWTGFQPTGIAPIYLPEDFFERVAWWPAVAHEIGHSFLASSRGLDAALRETLGLPPEQIGLRPLVLEGDGLSQRELRRVLGGWFEEMFCDVFGTLMLGEAYVFTMQHHFAAEGDPRDVLAVSMRPGTSHYGEHPPAQLRVMVGCRTLALAGQGEAATRLRQTWDERHAHDGQLPDRLLFPMGGGFLAVPLGPFEELVDELVTTLVRGPLPPLAGAGLADVGGLGYGPHAAADAGRARDALLRGRPPQVRDVRAIIAGAVLAAHARPELEATILAAARGAIPALGTAERSPDAYHQGLGGQAPPLLAGAARAPAAAAAAAWSRESFPVGRDVFTEAMMLAAILERPRAARRGG